METYKTISSKPVVVEPTISKVLTSCCALCQITAGNNTSKAELKAELKKLKREAYETDHYHTENNIGQRAAFVITTATEGPLENTLKSLGFTHVWTFDRRKGYPRTGPNKMWLKNW